MRLLARSHNETPFSCLSQALLQQDIEVKSAVMQVSGSRESSHNVYIIYGRASVFMV